MKKRQDPGLSVLGKNVGGDFTPLNNNGQYSGRLHKLREERNTSPPHQTISVSLRDNQRNILLRISHQRRLSAPTFRMNEQRGVLTYLVTLKPARPTSHWKGIGVPT